LFPPTVRSGRNIAAAGHHARGPGRIRVAARVGRAGRRLPRVRECRVIIIVTGTDTGVGKTIACAALAARAGPGSIVAKPTQTGVGTYGADTDVVRDLAGCDVVEFVRLADPLAPDTAARRHGIRLPSIEAHAERVGALAAEHDTVIVEGAGGLLVPLDNDGATLAELATTLATKHHVVIHIVTRLGLGTLNHTALTVAALRARA